MGQQEQRVYEAVEAAMADVQISHKEKNLFTAEDKDQIYEKTYAAVNDASSSFVAEAICAAIKHYVEGFHRRVIELAAEPENGEEFKDALEGILKRM